MEEKRLSFIWNDKKDFRDDDGLMAAIRELPFKTEWFDYSQIDEAKKRDIVVWWSPLYHKEIDQIEDFDGPKILCFAGGKRNVELTKKWDWVFVESKDYLEEFKSKGVENVSRAFGANVDIFYPEEQPKIFDAIFPATYASWKRQELFARALKDKGIACGKVQRNDLSGYEKCKAEKVLTLPHIERNALRGLLNASKSCVITSRQIGGSDRAVLEAMACNTPVITMNDAPKLCEYVEESGFGKIVSPDQEEIREAIKQVSDMKKGGREYILNNWSHKSYSKKIKDKIIELCQK